MDCVLTTFIVFPVRSFRDLAVSLIELYLVDLPPLQQLPSTLLMQNFPSLVTSRVLAPQPGETVLDCCAAPGNKWSHLAMLMKDQGIVVGGS